MGKIRIIALTLGVLALTLAASAGPIIDYRGDTPVVIQGGNVLPSTPDMLALVPGSGDMLATVAPAAPQMTWEILLLLCLVTAVAMVAAWLCKRFKANLAVFALLFSVGISSLFAADFVQRAFNAIVIRTGRNADSGTNGFITCYLPNQTNYLRFGTNGVPVFYGSTGNWTGFTGLNLISGGTNRYFGGWLVSTNTGTAPTP